MKVEIKFPAYDGSSRTFITWRPVKATARLLQPPAGPATVKVRLSSKSKPSGGAVVFAKQFTHNGADTLDLDLPTDGSPVDLWIGGKFPQPSSAYGDVSVEARRVAGAAPTSQLLASHPLMVRVRKNANQLTNTERDLFLSALATLNGQQGGPDIFRQFSDTHVTPPSNLPINQAHGDFGFLPWHRAFMLDLERALQTVRPEVTLPYWRFDQAAPKVFSLAFIGQPDSLLNVKFTAGHPLANWVSGGIPGIKRSNSVGPTTVPALLSEAQTLAIGASYAAFRGMEGDPHGPAHTSFGSGSWIRNIGLAAKDPLFFLLHCNVDRLWAKWQWLNKRHDSAKATSYGAPPGRLIGHNLGDTMWPWDDDKNFPRPPFAHRTPFPLSPMTALPGNAPQVRSMIDYLATASTTAEALDFAYHDIPFQL